MSEARFIDVRMRGFSRRAEVDAVVALLYARTAPLPAETISVLDAAGRVLAEPVASAVHVPSFARSAMDGYAVRAADTSHATPDEHAVLSLVGEAFPARPFDGAVKPGQAVRIATGAPLPAGADAVLMAEFARLEADGRVLVREPVAPGKHIVGIGEDVAMGSAVLPAGRCLRPQDVGLLASIGAATVRAIRRPRVAILVTGNELLPPGATATGFRIVDSNSPMLAALAARDGATVLPVRYLPDDFAAVRDGILAAATQADVILVSGGTSVGTEDHTPRAAAELGELAVHGIAVRPAGPTGIAFLSEESKEKGRRGEGVKGRTGEEGNGETSEGEEPSSPPLHPFTPSPLLFLIPGNPVACLCVYDLFAGRVVRRLGGRAWEFAYRSVSAPLASPIASVAGRVDYVRVKLASGTVVPLATGGAGNLSTVVGADGFVLVPPDRDGLAAGEVVDVWLYDG